jgi:hypothetical protein
LMVMLCAIACIVLAAAPAQAQMSASDKSGITVTKSEQPSMATETSDVVLGMVDRSELQIGALPNSAAQVINPHSADQHSAGKVLLPSESQGSEFASLAVLASAPSPSLLCAIQAKGLVHTDAAPAVSGNKALIYQLGAVNLVINGLPYSFSVSSVGSSVAGAR